MYYTPPRPVGGPPVPSPPSIRMAAHPDLRQAKEEKGAAGSAFQGGRAGARAAAAFPPTLHPLTGYSHLPTASTTPAPRRSRIGILKRNHSTQRDPTGSPLAQKPTPGQAISSSRELPRPALLFPRSTLAHARSLQPQPPALSSASAASSLRRSATAAALVLQIARQPSTASLHLELGPEKLGRGRTKGPPTRRLPWPP
jgi:hypothetical protein